MNCIPFCTRQHTQLPEDGCSLQPKHVGTLKTTVQLAGNNLVCMTVGNALHITSFNLLNIS